jgi:hypothetical protein
LIFHDFSIILSFITQRVFIAKTCACLPWKGYLIFIEQNSKNKKKPTTTIFSKKNLVSMTWSEITQNAFFFKISKNNHWTTTIWCMFCPSRYWCLPKLFFLLIFKDRPLENFDRFLKIDWLKNEKFKGEIQTAWSKDTSYSCRSFIIFLDFKNDWFLSNSVSNQLQQKKNGKKLLLGFLIFRILFVETHLSFKN